VISRLIHGLAAAALLAYAAGLLLVRDRFPAPGAAGVERDQVVHFVVFSLAVSLLHVGACIVCHRAPPKLWLVLLVAASARLLLLFGGPRPILEGDVERMRYDARLFNLGQNPYQFRPMDLLDDAAPDQGYSDAEREDLARAKAALSASETAPRPSDALHPFLRCTSTPLSIGILSLGDRLKPQSTRGFAFLILIADAATIFLLLLALRAMKLPLPWVMVYAWSPILLREAYSTLAPGLLVLPAIAGLVYGIARGARTLCALPVAFAAALRPAMLLLLPVFARRMGFFGFLLFLATLALPVLPFLKSPVPADRYFEGSVLAWRYQEYNSFAENLSRGLLGGMKTPAENSLGAGGIRVLEPGDPLGPFVAKLLTLVVLLGIVTYVTIRILPPAEHRSAHREGALGDLLVTLGALVLLGPVAHPWHALVLLPLLAVRPSIAWLALPGVLCLSHLTHLQGPRAGDLTLFGGTVSFRLFEYGLFGGLLVLDLLFGTTLFSRAPETAEEEAPRGFGDPARERAPKLDEDLAEIGS
jgi:hypothetical protein